MSKDNTTYICGGCGATMEDFYAVALDEKGPTYRCETCMDDKTKEYYARKFAGL